MFYFVPFVTSCLMKITHKRFSNSHLVYHGNSYSHNTVYFERIMSSRGTFLNHFATSFSNNNIVFDEPPIPGKYTPGSFVITFPGTNACVTNARETFGASWISDRYHVLLVSEVFTITTACDVVTSSLVLVYLFSGPAASLTFNWACKTTSWIF